MEELLQSVGGWKTVAGVVLGLVVISLLTRLFREKPTITARVKKRKCGQCGWFGEVPVRKPNCPNCGAS